MSLCLRIPRLGLNFDSVDEEDEDDEDDEDDEEEKLLIIFILLPPTIQHRGAARMIRFVSKQRRIVHISWSVHIEFNRRCTKLSTTFRSTSLKK